MLAFEKLGLFYLGKKLSPDRKALSQEYLLYDSKDLCTHAVCVGMTGSGKTGLCISLLEEAAIDRIPSLIIDPKGDMGNLLLTFPDLTADDFLPWVNSDEANKRNQTAEEYAAAQADLWKKGLSQWEQTGERIRMLQQSAQFMIYTPGSNAGLPVSIVDSFSAPPPQSSDDLDMSRERIQSSVSGLLTLLGIDADPLQNREHILISSIIEYCWMNGKDVGMGDLIQMIQSPPVTRIGVFNINDFYPTDDRLKLAISLNNLLAAPGFRAWMEGTPLDIDQLLYTPEGKPRTVIFSIAHLSDQERMFFVTLLLNQVIGWMRAQAGSTSLRAILYMDEVFGFLPPVSAPPSKRPLLTLLKQARAFGLGVVLSTQNPVDLDYKALSNAGTWFIGRLQTENDKERLVGGLTGGQQGGMFDKQALMEAISSLNKREFLIHNVHENQVNFFQTRWALSYLCGPLTRSQIKTLTAESRESQAAVPQHSTAIMSEHSEAQTEKPPPLPAVIRRSYASLDLTVDPDSRVVYHLFAAASADVTFLDNRYGILQTVPAAYALPLGEDRQDISWAQAKIFDFRPELFSANAAQDAAYMPVPATSIDLDLIGALDTQFEHFISRNFMLTLLQSETFKISSSPGESERDFRIRLQQTSRERRDLEVERLRRYYAKQEDSLQRQLETARRLVEKEGDQYKQKMLDTAITVGSSLFGALLGGRSARSSVTSAARSASRLSKEKGDIERAKQKMSQIEARMKELEEQLQEQIDDLGEKFDTQNEELKKIMIQPKKTDIRQKFFGFVWVPFCHGTDGSITSLNRSIS